MINIDNFIEAYITINGQTQVRSSCVNEKILTDQSLRRIKQIGYILSIQMIRFSDSNANFISMQFVPQCR